MCANIIFLASDAKEFADKDKLCAN